MSSAFDAKRALEFARSISRPRLCGTAEERAVSGEVKKALEAAGWPVEEEFFEFRPVADALLRASLLLTHAGLAAVLYGAWREPRVAFAGLAWLLAMAAFIPWLIRRTFRSSVRGATPGLLPGWILSSNLSARADGPADGPLLVFVAHYDSKSQSLSLGARIALFNGSRTAAFGFLGASLARLFGADVPLPLLAAAAAAVLLLCLPLYALRTGNRSPGAMDNASGVGALVEMARIWKSLPVSRRSRAVFLAVSGEEFGMVGSQAWVTKHRDALRREKRLRVLNFDGVGYAGPVRVIPAWGKMSEAVVAAGKAVDIEILRFPRSQSLMTDHASFTRERLPCATILTHSWAARRLHTAEDSADTLKQEGFERVGRIALRLIEDELS